MTMALTSRLFTIIFFFLKYFHYLDKIDFANLFVTHRLSFCRTCLAFEDFREF